MHPSSVRVGEWRDRVLMLPASWKFLKVSNSRKNTFSRFFPNSWQPPDLCVLAGCEWRDIAQGSHNCSPLGTLRSPHINISQLRITRLIRGHHSIIFNFPFLWNQFLHVDTRRSAQLTELLWINFGFLWTVLHRTETPSKKCWTFPAGSFHLDLLTQ